MAIRPPLYDDRHNYITPKPTDLISGGKKEERRGRTGEEGESFLSLIRVG
ncbi:MAG: hypothetical protein F6K39_37630 [Okeania sp. SIO3B3]|nr:hypothetical protein [Okeania sp. SIO3B3]